MGYKSISGLVINLLLLVHTGTAQYVNYGQDPSRLRWKQINTDNFQIIYPDFYEYNAQKIANIYEALYHRSNSLGHTPCKISMIIHAEDGISNGSVTWAPKRSDLYATPPQNPTDSWLEHLCIHEFRHVVQIDKVNQGFTKFLYYIFGEQLTIAVVGVYVPTWFLEGDATCFETSVGKIGRGRSPEFLNEMKAQVLDKGIYTYYKAVLGSYKDFVPNRYTLGYYMVGLGRTNYGNSIWSDALQRVGRRPLGITPFATSLKHTLNLRRDSLWSDSTYNSLFVNPDSVKKANTYKDAKLTLYHDNLSEMQQIWERENRKVHQTFDTIATRNKYYTNYYYPTPTTEGSLIAYKKGLRQSGAFVLLDKGKEKLLTHTGVLYDYRFAVHGNQIVWTEYRPGLRWELGGKMLIAEYNRTTGKYTRHSGEHNRYSPFATEKGWGFVEVNHKNEASIVIKDSLFRNELFRITSHQSELFIHPSYKDGKIITIVQDTAGLHIESISVPNGERRQLTNKMSYELDNPQWTGNSVLYRASFNGNNSFYLTDTTTGETRRVIDSKYGVRFPTINPIDSSIVFSFYTADGYKPGFITNTGLLNEPADKMTFRIADSLKVRENWKLPLQEDSLFHSKHYGKTAHLLNVHSWGPIGLGFNNQEINFGLAVYSQNKLSTLEFSLGFLKDQDYTGGAVVAKATYSGWWPVFEVNFKTGATKYYNQGIATYQNAVNDTLLIHNKALHTKADVSILLPLNFSTRHYIRTLQPHFRYKINALHHIRIKDIFGGRENTDYDIPTPARYYQSLEYGLSFSNQTRMTAQDINPRWGQSLQAGYSHTPLKDINYGSIWWADGRFYFPGLFWNHTLSVYAGHQQMSNKNIYYDNEILYPRGIKLYGYNLSSLRSSYKLPFCYPDAHISSLLYIKRVTGGIFYDIAKENNTRNNSFYQSYGGEITADTHFLRLPFPFNIGIRYGYETKTRRTFADFLFSVGLSI